MMEERVIFVTRDLEKPNFIQKILKKHPKSNLIIEINNLLAGRKLTEISVEDIQNISEKYKVNLTKKFKDEVENFYREYLEHCFNDRKLTDNEAKDLSHLKDILCLTDPAVSRIHDEVARNLYKESVEMALSDGHLDDIEKEFLKKIQKELKLPEDIAKNIYNTKAEERLKRYLDGAISDSMLSPEEERELNEISKNLGVTVPQDNKTQTLLEKYKLYWLIANGDIPEIYTDINLQRNEKCYFKTWSDSLEQRRVTRRISYGGPTLRVKIIKGVYWRAGNLGVSTTSDEIWKQLDSGNLYLTNKRLIFMGKIKNTTILLSKILDFDAYSNGVMIQKSTGRNPFFKFNENVDIFSMMLGRAIRDLS